MASLVVLAVDVPSIRTLTTRERTRFEFQLFTHTSFAKTSTPTPIAWNLGGGSPLRKCRMLMAKGDMIGFYNQAYQERLPVIR